jgi:hypothetical protein
VAGFRVSTRPKTLGPSNRGPGHQSTEPSRPTSAAVAQLLSSARSPISVIRPVTFPHSAPGTRVTPPHRITSEGALTVATQTEGGEVTGTKDKDYNLIWFVEQSLSNALRLQTYIEDAERENDSELADFFRRAQAASRKGGEQGKELLRKRVAA